MSQEARHFLISFPKCGRTWVRYIFAVLEGEVKKRGGALPPVLATHDDDPHWKYPHELSRDKTSYANSSVLFMARDPRDVVVSLYFERTRRIHLYQPEWFAPELRERVKKFEGTISEFLREPCGSFGTLVEFYNLWCVNRGVPEKFFLLRYEELYADPIHRLNSVLRELFGIAVSPDLLSAVVAQCSFEKMHALEGSGLLNHMALTPGDATDPESFKTRRGKQGGYVDYLSHEDITYLNNIIDSKLDPWFGYGAKKPL